MKIGWVGLGGIGKEMVKRALGAGHDVTVYARGQGLAEVQAAGATSAAAYPAVAADKDVLALCVFDDDQMRAVLLEGGALAAMRSGAVLVIHTTGSPGLARALQEQAPDGVVVIDATFSGGPAETAAGTLTLIIGGEAGAIEKARPLLAAYAETFHHVGGLGRGQVVKLLNNLLFAANLQNAVETLRIAALQQIDAAACARVFHDSSAASYAGSLFRSAPVDALLQSARPYLVKDVKAAMAAAAELGIDTAAFAGTAAYFRDPMDNLHDTK